MDAIFFWLVALLAIAPALLVAGGYWDRGIVVAAPVAGFGLVLLALFDGETLLAVALLVFTVATLQRRMPSGDEIPTSTVSWGRGLGAMLFCGIAGGILVAVIGSLDGGSGELGAQGVLATSHDGTSPEGTSIFPSRLFQADLVLLWLVASVALLVGNASLPTMQRTTATAAQPNRHPLP